MVLLLRLEARPSSGTMLERMRYKPKGQPRGDQKKTHLKDPFGGLKGSGIECKQRRIYLIGCGITELTMYVRLQIQQSTAPGTLVEELPWESSQARHQTYQNNLILDSMTGPRIGTTLD